MPKFVDFTQSCKEWRLNVWERWLRWMNIPFFILPLLGAIIAFWLWFRSVTPPLPIWILLWLVGGALLFFVMSFLAFHRVRLERDELQSEATRNFQLTDMEVGKCLDELNQKVLTVSGPNEETKKFKFSEILLRYVTELTNGVTSGAYFDMGLNSDWGFPHSLVPDFLVYLCEQGILETRHEDYEDRVLPSMFSGAGEFIQNREPYQIRNTKTKYYMTPFGLKLVKKLREQKGSHNDRKQTQG